MSGAALIEAKYRALAGRLDEATLRLWAAAEARSPGRGVRKTREGALHPDRDAQFPYIATMVADFQRQRQPVISVDTKEKELIRDFKNAGKEWHPAGQPEPVRVHDFIDPQLGKVAPYGVYDHRSATSRPAPASGTSGP